MNVLLLSMPDSFEHMPELKSTWGYPVVLGVMAMTGTAMLYFFKQKKWL